MTAIIALTIITGFMSALGYILSQSVQTETFDLHTGCKNPVRVVHVGDTHFPHCFLSQDDLLTLISEQKPDVTVFTGDIADAEATEADIRALVPFFTAASKISPCFLVIGNHEIGSEHLTLFLQTAKNSGINVLTNQVATVSIKGTDFAFIGLSDGYAYEKKTFASLPNMRGKIKILLSHRPEKFNSYASAPSDIRPDIVFSGHAHGGLLRLGNAAVYAPNQGLFPKYTSGVYMQDNLKMVVTRGLGISGVDFRAFNRYHLPVAVLTA